MSAPDLTPGSDEWNRRITASKVAAILGVSPWESPRSVWHQMRGDTPRPETNAAMSRGTYLEPGILAWWRDQHPDYVRWDEQHAFTLGEWAAATPDENGELDGEPVLVEAKTAAYDDDWGDPGTDVIPAYYLVQVYWQMHLSGVHRCYVPVLTSRLRLAEYVVDYTPEIGADLEIRMRAFYDSLSADTPPPLDDTVATFESMKRLHPEIDRGETVHLDRADALELAEAAAAVKAAEARDRLARSTVLEQMGRAQYAACEGVRVARRQPRGDAVTFVVTAKPGDLTDTTEEGTAA